MVVPDLMAGLVGLAGGAGKTPPRPRPPPSTEHGRWVTPPTVRASTPWPGPGLLRRRRSRAHEHARHHQTARSRRLAGRGHPGHRVPRQPRSFDVTRGTAPSTVISPSIAALLTPWPGRPHSPCSAATRIGRAVSRPHSQAGRQIRQHHQRHVRTGAGTARLGALTPGPVSRWQGPHGSSSTCSASRPIYADRARRPVPPDDEPPALTSRSAHVSQSQVTRFVSTFRERWPLTLDNLTRFFALSGRHGCEGSMPGETA